MHVGNPPWSRKTTDSSFLYWYVKRSKSFSLLGTAIALLNTSTGVVETFYLDSLTFPAATLLGYYDKQLYGASVSRDILTASCLHRHPCCQNKLLGRHLGPQT